MLKTRNPLLECRSAVAGDKSRFIDADDIGDWFAKMMITEINKFINMFKCRDIMRGDFANDWEDTIKFVCRPTIKEIKSLRKFWSQKKLREDGRSPADARKLWFIMADGGAVAKRKINPEKQSAWDSDMGVKEQIIFKDLITSDYGWMCEIPSRDGYTTLSPYFKRMTTELNGLRAVITTHYGWLFFRGINLQCYGYDCSKGSWDNTDYLQEFLDRYGCGNRHRDYKTWEKILFKKQSMIKINKFCLDALYNPHTELGRKHANKLYDENFAEQIRSQLDLELDIIMIYCLVDKIKMKAHIFDKIESGFYIYI